MNFRSEVSSCATCPVVAMVWINKIESAKSIADPKTSYSIYHQSQFADKLRGS